MNFHYLRVVIIVLSLGFSVAAVAANMPATTTSSVRKPQLLGSFGRRSTKGSHPYKIVSLKPLGLKMNHSKIQGKDGISRYRAYKLNTQEIPPYLHQMMQEQVGGARK